MFVRESIFRIMGTKIVLQHNRGKAECLFLMYARIGRQTVAQSGPIAATVWFAE
jgi:hypothetical protein